VRKPIGRNISVPTLKTGAWNRNSVSKDAMSPPQVRKHAPFDLILRFQVIPYLSSSTPPFQSGSR
jgi:hypothetical protein